jgi:hypothetical protein
MSMKKYIETIGNRTRDLLACSAVPQPLHHRNNNNKSNNVKVKNVYGGIQIKIVAHVDRMYLCVIKNLCGDEQHKMLPMLPNRRHSGCISYSAEESRHWFYSRLNCNEMQ